jgi:hypothetical protein
VSIIQRLHLPEVRHGVDLSLPMRSPQGRSPLSLQPGGWGWTFRRRARRRATDLALWVTKKGGGKERCLRNHWKNGISGRCVGARLQTVPRGATEKSVDRNRPATLQREAVWSIRATGSPHSKLKSGTNGCAAFCADILPTLVCRATWTGFMPSSKRYDASGVGH